MKLDLVGSKCTVVSRVLIGIALLLAGKFVSDFHSSRDRAAAKLLDASSGPKTKKQMNQDTLPDPTLDYRRLQLTENQVYEERAEISLGPKLRFVQ